MSFIIDESGYNSNSKFALPTEFGLISAFPNPFNNHTTIKYQVKDAGLVKLSIYGIDGRLVKELYNGFSKAGYYSLSMNAADFASNIYFARLESNGHFDNLKLTLIK